MLFDEKLGSELGCVALTVITETNATIENLNSDDRRMFIKGLERRFDDPNDDLRRNFVAASPLVYALLYSGLPSFTLTIERTADLGLMSFKEAVSLEGRQCLPASQQSGDSLKAFPETVPHNFILMTQGLDWKD